jgi:hypothetical protein
VQPLTLHLNLGDSIDGGQGTDTLNLVMSAPNAAFPGGASIAGVEIVNINVSALATTAGPAVVSPASYAGVEQLWQIDNNSANGSQFANVTVSAGVTAGFRSTGTGAAAPVSATVTAATATQKSATVALDGVGSVSTIVFMGGDLETINVAGSVATVAAFNGLVIWDTNNTDTANISLSSDTTVFLVDVGTTLETIDLSGSTGDITLDTSWTGSSSTALTSLIGGSGADTLTVNLETGAGVTVDAGAGNDTVLLQGWNFSGVNSVSEITLGAGKDTLTTLWVSNIADVDVTKFEDGIIEVTDFSLADDTINLNGWGLELTAAQLDNAANEATLFDAVTYIAGILNGLNGVFSYGNDAYILADNGAAGVFDNFDGLIKLTGVDATQLSTDQNGGLVL